MSSFDLHTSFRSAVLIDSVLQDVPIWIVHGVFGETVELSCVFDEQVYVLLRVNGLFNKEFPRRQCHGKLSSEGDNAKCSRDKCFSGAILSRFPNIRTCFAVMSTATF